MEENDLITIPTLGISQIEDVTRRTLITGAFAAALLAACGGDDEDEGPEASPTPATRSIETAKGPVEVPTKPQRVVCIHMYPAYDLLDLGFKPVGVPQLPAASIRPLYTSDFQGATTVGSVAEPDPEKIASLAPDLILGLITPAIDQIYARLSAIAPTVLLQATPATANWEELVRRFADAASVGDDASALQKQFEDRAASLKTSRASVLAAKKGAIIQARGTEWYVFLPDSSHGAIMAKAGVRFTSNASGQTGAYKALTYEQIGELQEADFILASATADGQIDADTKALIGQPGFDLLPAAKAGKVFPARWIFPTSYKQALAFLDELDAVLKSL